MAFTDELQDVDRALTLLKAYSVEPASQPEGYVRGSTQTFGTGAADFSGFRHEVVDSTMRLAWVDLTENTKHTIRAGGCGAAGSLQINADVKQKANWAPTYYLPWDHKGAAVEMTIPQSASNDLNKHPQVFFTTCLSGCSVIFKGTAQRPTVYHCGSQDLAMPYDANRFWEDFVKYIDSTQSTVTAGSNYASPIASQATKSQYVSGVVDKKAPPGPTGSAPSLTTETTLGFRKEMKQQYGDQIALQQLIPWGSVFGLRRGDNWKFYLQENVNLIYYTQQQVERVREYRLGIGSGPSVNFSTRKQFWQSVGSLKVVSRPMVVREVFPNGNGVPMARTNFRSLV